MGRPGGNRRIRGGGRALTWRYEVWSLQHFEIKILSEKIFKSLYVRDNFTIFLIVCIGCTWAVWVDARTSRDQEHQSHQSWIVIGPTVTSSQLYHSITASFDEHWASYHPPPPVLQPPASSSSSWAESGTTRPQLALSYLLSYCTLRNTFSTLLTMTEPLNFFPAFYM